MVYMELQPFELIIVREFTLARKEINNLGNRLNNLGDKLTNIDNKLVNILDDIITQHTAIDALSMPLNSSLDKLKMSIKKVKEGKGENQKYTLLK